MGFSHIFIHNSQTRGKSLPSGNMTTSRYIWPRCVCWCSWCVPEGNWRGGGRGKSQCPLKVKREEEYRARIYGRQRERWPEREWEWAALPNIIRKGHTTDIKIHKTICENSNPFSVLNPHGNVVQVYLSVFVLFCITVSMFASHVCVFWFYINKCNIPQIHYTVEVRPCFYVHWTEIVIYVIQKLAIHNYW